MSNTKAGSQYWYCVRKCPNYTSSVLVLSGQVADTEDVQYSNY